jgi:alpha-tubulin suppressor-like RCC1 family protein
MQPLTSLAASVALFLLPLTSLHCAAQPNLPSGFYNDLDDVSVSSGYYHTCAIEHRPGIPFGGPLKCWGSNDFGQLNHPSGSFVQVSCGHLFSCAVSLDETIKCWGDPAPAPPNGLFTQVSTGEFHACGIMKDGSLKCWGSNNHGEGNAPSGDFVQVTAGNGSTCGLRPNGTVECWGRNHWKQCNVPPGKLFKQISSSLNMHVCGIEFSSSESHGDVVCWGLNNRGQSEGRQGDFTQVSAGSMSTCAIREDKTIDCWGAAIPIPHNDLLDEDGEQHVYDQISMGSEHACGISADGDLHCWHKGGDVGAHQVPLGFEVA